MREMNARRWERTLAVREVERQAVKTASASWVGALSDRELELIAVTAYWCEGAKDKAYARREKVRFINSDPGIVLLFLEFLRRRGFNWPDLYMALSIHESADIPAAERWWAETVGADVSDFAKPTIKRHRPRTNRKNTGQEYVGCFYVAVRGSRTLYQQIEGIWRGIATGFESGAGGPLVRQTGDVRRHV
ncbi:MAG: hypothetical protein H0V92_06575 [Pseudonocardiales bacterium]|nr:hypothetical protein [Pseudonocardiales bacterium]